MSHTQPVRKRVSVACTTCRKKRIKCDGGKPSCSKCSGEAEKCEYIYDEEKRKPPSKQRMKALEARVEFLEAELSRLQATENIFTDQSVFLPSAHQPEPYSMGLSENISSKSHTDPIDSLTEVLGGLSIAEGNQLRYFGSRCTLSLIEQQLHSSEPPPLSEPTLHQPFREVDVQPEVQQRLLKLYWEWQNPWQYLVHKDLFTKSLETQIYDDYCTPLLLYSMLSLAARYVDSSDDPIITNNLDTLIEDFTRNAKAFLFEEIEAPRVSTVVAAVHISLNEMAKNNEPAGWTYIGMAIRMAYNLGLHINPDRWVSSGTMTPGEAELRSIAWWGCYMVEKLFTVGIGRPSIIIERDIQVALPSKLIDAEYGKWDGGLESMAGANSLFSYSITTFHNACRMLRLTQPLDDIYAPNNYVSALEKKRIMTKLNVDLMSFYNNIPSVLRVPASLFTQPMPPHMYCFHMHFHGLIILLHRPFIVAPSESDSSSKLPNDTAISSLHECTISAERVTRLLRVYSKFYSMRKISISVVDPASTAALIHLFNMTSSDTVVKERSRSFFKETLRYLEQMSVSWGWAIRSIRALNNIAHKWAVHDEINLHSSLEPFAEDFDNEDPQSIIPPNFIIPHDMNFIDDDPFGTESSNFPFENLFDLEGLYQSGI